MLLAISTSLMAAGVEPTGTPRQVSTLDHLLWISTNSSSWDDAFEQTADIDASGTSTWNGGEGFEPIGTHGNRFTGTFDGPGYKITNLYINRPSANYVGLFGRTDSGSEIKNVGLEDGSVSASDYVGGLVGINNGTISNSYS